MYDNNEQYYIYRVIHEQHSINTKLPTANTIELNNKSNGGNQGCMIKMSISILYIITYYIITLLHYTFYIIHEQHTKKYPQLTQ